MIGAQAKEISTTAIAASMMCANMCDVISDVRLLEASGVDALHFDLMDGHFVPNVAIGFEIMQQLRRKTGLIFDVHLMALNSELFVAHAATIGCERIAVHIESGSTEYVRTVVDHIHEAGAEAGLAVSPSTPLERIGQFVGSIEYVLLLLVNPGFSGSPIVVDGPSRVAECTSLIRSFGSRIVIEVDGGIGFENAGDLVDAGARVLVAGTRSVFRSDIPITEGVCRLRKAIRRA